MLRIFYVTDIHGSEICWRKFLNAGPFYGADVVIVGGDITGKAMVPIVERGGHWETTVQDQHVVLETDAEVAGVRDGTSSTAGTTRSGSRRRSTATCRRTRTRSTSASRRSCSRGPSAGSRWPTTSSRAR